MSREELRREFHDITPPKTHFGSYRPVDEEISFRYRDAIFDWLYSKLESHQKRISDLTAKLKAAEEIIERADKNQNQ